MESLRKGIAFFFIYIYTKVLIQLWFICVLIILLIRSQTCWIFLSALSDSKNKSQN